jgi:hypothetical protein
MMEMQMVSKILDFSSELMLLITWENFYTHKNLFTLHNLAQKVLKHFSLFCNLLFSPLSAAKNVKSISTLFYCQ